MIFDHLDNTSHYALSDKWQKAFEYLKTLSADTPDGEYPIVGDEVYAKVLSYETRTPEAGNIESHEAYADIQICLVGAEGIDLYDSEALTPKAPYDATKDLVFYEPNPRIARVDIHPGHFVILWPRDAHRPQMIVGENARMIKKAVVKVLI